MSRNFRFQRAENFDLVAPVWHVSHKQTAIYVGEVSRETAGNYRVRRPSESSFHGTYATRVQAARWLKNRLASSVNFEDDNEPDGDEDIEAQNYCTIWIAFGFKRYELPAVAVAGALVAHSRNQTRCRTAQKQKAAHPSGLFLFDLVPDVSDRSSNRSRSAGANLARSKSICS
jgi:hypothetical protein